MGLRRTLGDGVSQDEVKAAALSEGRAAEDEILLLCSRTDVSPSAVERAAELVEQGVDWDYVWMQACSHGVVPLVHRVLRKEGRNWLPPETARDFQVGTYSLGALSHLRIVELVAIHRACGAKGLRAISFKGPALAALAYGDAYRRRPGGDLDILTTREDFAQVRDILMERGYTPRVPIEEHEGYLKTRSGIAFTKDSGSVDLHWTLEQQAFDGLPFSFRLDPEHIAAHAVTVALGETPIQTLRREDALLYLCAHGAKHSWSSLYLVCDIAEVVRGELDWDWIEQEARRQRTERILHLGLLLAQGLLGARLPDRVRQRAEADIRARSLARQVGARIFDPNSTAGARWHTLRESVQHYWFRLTLLGRVGEKASYLALRGLRKLSNWHAPKGTRPLE